MFILIIEIILGLLALAFLALVAYAIFLLYALVRVSKSLQKETNHLILDAHSLHAGLKKQRGCKVKLSLVGQSIKKTFLRWLIS